MINFKHSSRRSIRRERNENLSIVTGGRPIIRVGDGGQAGSFKRHKRVSIHDEKLKRDFTNARIKAYSQMGECVPGTANPAPFNYLLKASESPYFTINENKPTTSIISSLLSSPNQQPQDDVLEGSRPHNGQYTINSLPPLLKTSQSRRAVLSLQSQPRGILRPLSGNVQNSIYGHGGAVYGNSGGQNAKLDAPLHTKFNAKKSSSWKICSSMPMTRQSASMVQFEMASTMSGSSDSSGCSTGSYFPFSLTNENLQNQDGITDILESPAPRHVLPSLLKGIVPPPSPLVPISPDNNSTSSLNRSMIFNPCGVHQSEWIDRNKCAKRTPMTKQYSMEQIIDVLCGFATPDSIMAAQLFQPFPSPPPLPMPSFPSAPPLPIPSFLSASPLPIPSFPSAPPLPIPSFPSALPSTPASPISNQPPNQSEICQTDNFQFETIRTKSNAPLVMDSDDDDGGTSVYFKNSSKKKSVSFLTDNSDNICVTEYLFDPYSQEFCRDVVCFTF